MVKRKRNGLTSTECSVKICRFLPLSSPYWKWSYHNATQSECARRLGSCVFVGNLIQNFTLHLRVTIYTKKLRASDCQITSPFFHVTRVQFCCLWNINSCLLTPNCTRNHVVTYTKNVHETFTGFRLAENECICHVTRVQRWNMSANYK